jgi:hypothetical protein
MFSWNYFRNISSFRVFFCTSLRTFGFMKLILVLVCSRKHQSKLNFSVVRNVSSDLNENDHIPRRYSVASQGLNSSFNKLEMEFNLFYKTEISCIEIFSVDYFSFFYIIQLHTASCFQIKVIEWASKKYTFFMFLNPSIQILNSFNSNFEFFLFKFRILSIQISNSSHISRLLEKLIRFDLWSRIEKIIGSGSYSCLYVVISWMASSLSCTLSWSKSRACSSPLAWRYK